MGKRRSSYYIFPNLSMQLGDWQVTLDFTSHAGPRVWNVLRHSHHNFELHSVSEGSGILLTDEGKYDISAGSTYLTGPDIYHSQYSGESGMMDEYSIRFDIKYHRSQYSDRGVNDIINNIVEHPFFITDSDSIGCQPLIKEMIEENKQRRDGYREKITCLFGCILINLGRRIRESLGDQDQDHEPPVKDTGDEDSLTTSIGEIDLRARLDAEFVGHSDFATQEELAERFHISDRHFSRLMQQYYGMSYTEKVNEVRCGFASEMLENSDATIAEVCVKSGFQSYAYFGRVFKRLTGMSPSEYRKAKRNK